MAKALLLWFIWQVVLVFSYATKPQNVKINFDFSNNNFNGGALNKVDRKDKNAFLTRLQLKF